MSNLPKIVKCANSLQDLAIKEIHFLSFFQSALSGPPAPPSDASTVDAMIAHQVILDQNDDLEDG